MDPLNTRMEVSVIIPARDEADSIAACLRSLVAQQDEHFQLGREWEILVVDDHSTDNTAAIAKGFAGVRVLSAPPLADQWTGKSAACWTGAQASTGEWVLFTDADTVHQPGSLRRALHEAEKYSADMLSYSPRQITHGVVQRAVMPLIFAELARAYPPDKVSSRDSRLAAANGQFLLVRRSAYEAIGGHRAVSDRVLEDVELARLVKKRGLTLRFRYAPDAVAAHMYRTLGAMFEGWTKNLSLLFSNAISIAAMRMFEFVILIACIPLAIYAAPLATMLPVYAARLVILLLWFRVALRFFRFTAASNFPVGDRLLSVFGLPVYAWLLYQSWFRRNVIGRVSWKGRTYGR